MIFRAAEAALISLIIRALKFAWPRQPAGCFAPIPLPKDRRSDTSSRLQTILTRMGAARVTLTVTFLD
jgi:hypothetical protein